MDTTTARRASVLVALGGTVWFAAAGAFQLGLLAALLVVWRTGVAGTGRGGRFVAGAALAFLALALVWTIGTVLALGMADDPANLADVPGAAILVVLDLFWPLSMAWMLVVGVAVLRAQVWPMPVRALPLVASFILPAHLVAELFGLTAWQRWTLPILYVVAAYAALGVALAVQAPAVASQAAEDHQRELAPPVR